MRSHSLHIRMNHASGGYWLLSAQLGDSCGLVNPVPVVGDVGIDPGQLGAGTGDTPGHQAYQGTLTLLQKEKGILDL